MARIAALPADRQPPFAIAGDVVITSFRKGDRLSPEQQRMLAHVVSVLAEVGDLPNGWLSVHDDILELVPCEFAERWVQQRMAHYVTARYA